MKKEQPSSAKSDAATLATTLRAKIAERDFTVGVMGLGYVGLPLVLLAVNAGFKVIGFDTNASRVTKLNQGISGIKHVPNAAVAAAIEGGKLSVTGDFTRLGEPDAILIAVPTPLTRNREPDLTYVEQSAAAIAKSLRRGQLVVLESTTWPGTTHEIVEPVLESAGLKAGKDFFVAFSPEREDPGNAKFATATIPKVVGADDTHALGVANALYEALVVKTVPVSSAATAEAVKLTENIFRSVNIALVNELKLIYDRMGIDVWEVIDAAKTKPFGFMPFYPGPGLGGHCIPIDPFYLTWKAREFGVSTRFVELAGQINTAMPQHVVDRLAAALDMQAGRGLNGSRVLVIGAAYKKNVDDMRESPSLTLIEMIEKRGARVDYHDPYIPVLPVTREHAALSGRKSARLDADSLAGYQAVLIATDHDSVDYGLIARAAKLVVDTRNACGSRGLTGPHIVKA